MSDALLSPAVGGAMCAASGALLVHCARRVAREDDPAKTPLMGVLAAFVFAAQMINFSIPGTGSSGHLGGGLLLTILLGPHRAFLAIASVLVVQCLLFADGGLLALGCNIFNLGFFPAFVAYPFVYRPLVGSAPSGARPAIAALAAAVVGLELGAFAVVVETLLSGLSDLPFAAFLLFMLPIHLAIGLVEGFVTWGVVAFVTRARPALVAGPAAEPTPRPTLAALAVAALAVGGVLSWFASSHPDGLEWSIARVTGAEEFEGRPNPVTGALASLQERTALLPDYGFKSGGDEAAAPATPVNLGTSVSGVVGSAVALLLAVGLGWIVRTRAGAPPRGNGG